CINTGVNSQLGEVWQQQLAQADFKVRISPLPLAVHNPERVFPAKFDLFVGGQPGGDTPYRAIRNQHSDTGDQFTNVGLYDSSMDALIEKGEQATDREENIKLVKEAQMKALNAYSLSYITMTAQSFMFYSNRLQNWEIDPLFGQNYETQAWFAS
ncbi:MAG: hypothetical protein AB7G38_09530, partial [Dehalococcoidia bacterium]